MVLCGRSASSMVADSLPAVYNGLSATPAREGEEY